MPVQQITFKVDVEIDYDPFKGKTPEQLADSVHDDLYDCLSELRPEDVSGIFTNVISTTMIETAD